MALTVFCQPVYKAYQAGYASKAFVFNLVATLLTFIPPILIAYRSQGEEKGTICLCLALNWCVDRILAKDFDLQRAANRSLQARIARFVGVQGKCLRLGNESGVQRGFRLQFREDAHD